MMSRGNGFAKMKSSRTCPRLRKINLYPCANRFLIGFPTGEEIISGNVFRGISSGRIAVRT